MKRAFLALAALVTATAVLAQNVAAAPADATTGARNRSLQPFVASYAVFRGGKPFGDATLQLARVDGARWQVDLDVRGTRGLLGLAGLNVQQSTLFEDDAGQYRPLGQSTVRKALFGNRKTTGIYDWSTHTAQWRGDVKETRRAPVPLRDGDMSGLLVNLAVLRDAQPGATLQYRFVDDGRVRDHQYSVASEREPVAIDQLGYNAMRATRTKHGGEETILWVVEGVPMPIRILQRENGQDVNDLRLMEYK